MCIVLLNISFTRFLSVSLNRIKYDKARVEIDVRRNVKTSLTKEICKINEIQKGTNNAKRVKKRHGINIALKYSIGFIPLNSLVIIITHEIWFMIVKTNMAIYIAYGGNPSVNIKYPIGTTEHIITNEIDLIFFIRPVATMIIEIGSLSVLKQLIINTSIENINVKGG